MRLRLLLATLRWAGGAYVLTGLMMVLSSRRGKLRARDRLLDRLALAPDALTVVLTAVLAFDPRGFWEMAEKKLDDTAPPRPADGPASASASSTSERAT